MNDTDFNPIRRTPVQAPLFPSLGEPPPPCLPPPPLGGEQVAPTADLILLTFNFEGTEVRIIDRDGNPWYVAADICAVLEIKNVSQAVSRLDDDEKDNIISNDVTGRPHKIVVISHPGAVILTMTSRSPNAQPFKRWLAHDVAESIRKTGAYGMPDLRDPVQALAILTQSLQLNQEYRARLEVADARLAVVEPKAANHDSLSGAGGGIGTYKAARILRYPPKTFGEWLVIAGYLFRRGRVLEPYADKVAKGLLFLKVDKASNGYMYTQPLITARGMQHFTELQLAGKIPIPENKF